MARMVGPRGRVVGLEAQKELCEQSRRNVAADPRRPENLVLVHGDGWEGYAREGPYDAIHVGAAAEDFPAALEAQLAPGGRMVIPVGTYRQIFYLVTKHVDGSIARQPLFDVNYVPLVKPNSPSPLNQYFVFFSFLSFFLWIFFLY